MKPSDIDRFYGKRPAYTMRAVAAYLDGEPVGILGIARSPEGNRYFSDIRPELEPYLRTMPVLRAIHASREFIRQATPPVYAVIERPEAETALRHLGFQRDKGDVFIWAG